MKNDYDSLTETENYSLIMKDLKGVSSFLFFCIEQGSHKCRVRAVCGGYSGTVSCVVHDMNETVNNS